MIQNFRQGKKYENTPYTEHLLNINTTDVMSDILT